MIAFRNLAPQKKCNIVTVVPHTNSNRKENINHFEAIFNNATIGIIVTGANGAIIFANPYALKEFGYKLVEVIGKKVELLVPQRFHKSHATYHKNFAAEPQTRQMGSGRDLFAIRKNGTELPVEISLSNYSFEGNNYVISFINNIAIRKKAEAVIDKLHEELETKVEQRTKELKLSKDKLEGLMAFQKAVLDNAGAMIIATDENGIIKYFNPEASFNIGYADYELINKQTPIIFHDKNEINFRKGELLNKFGIKFIGDFAALVEKARRNIHDEERYTYIRKDGTTFPVSLTITAIKNKKNVITGYMGVAIDVSERVKFEQELLESLEKEKELNELKTRFVSMASHEFRTPLSTVLSSSYLIEKYITTEDQPKREKHLQRIVSSVNMLTDILNDFLSLGKIEAGKINVKIGSVNIQQLINAILVEIKNNLKADQKIYYEHEGEMNTWLDASLMKHIVMNLVSNASKFSPDGSVINIKTIIQNNQLILYVKDNGMGISKQDQEHLFERFFRGTNATNIQGTGLGLHIVSKYVELMNGTIACKSELEKGTEFIITFNNKLD